MLSKTVRLRDLTYQEFMTFPADEFYLLTNALAVWEDARREEREAQARMKATSGAA